METNSLVGVVMGSRGGGGGRVTIFFTYTYNGHQAYLPSLHHSLYISCLSKRSVKGSPNTKVNPENSFFPRGHTHEHVNWGINRNQKWKLKWGGLWYTSTWGWKKSTLDCNKSSKSLID